MHQISIFNSHASKCRFSSSVFVYIRSRRVEPRGRWFEFPSWRKNIFFKKMSEVNKMKSAVSSEFLVPSTRTGFFSLCNVYFLVLFISQVSSVDLKGKSINY